MKDRRQAEEENGNEWVETIEAATIAKKGGEVKDEQGGCIFLKDAINNLEAAALEQKDMTKTDANIVGKRPQ